MEPEPSDSHTGTTGTRPPLRLWPARLILTLVAGTILFARLQGDWPFQKRNLTTLAACILGFLALLIWWLTASRAPWRTRLAGLALMVALYGGYKTAFRLKGVTGDFVPIIEARWKSPPVQQPGARQAISAPPAAPAKTVAPDYPQFLGPARTGMVPGPPLRPDWTNSAPQLLWRQPVGAAWSGFAIVGQQALTQEQQGAQEWVSAFDISTGRRQWTHTNEARYATTIAGEGPRTTPTVVSNRVYTLGATGILDCLDLTTGKLVWTRSVTQDAGSSVPDWGFAGSPWVDASRVVVQGGGGGGRSLLAYRPDTGELLWAAGDEGLNYGSPLLVTLDGKPQIVIFGGRKFAGHDPTTGAVLWEHPFGVGMPLVANPILVSTNRVLITAGYNVGAELLEFTNSTAPPRSVWTSKRLKAKFANPVRQGEFVYGLDDGMLSCLDLRDGSQRWKEGRYGHGQGVWVADQYLLMSESGTLVLLRPTPEGPNELARLAVFDSKTWNPIALSGDRLLVRNDREAACFRVAR